MKRPGPLLKMTFALVALCGTLVMLADLFFGVLPDRAAQTQALRKSFGEALAVQVATLLEGDDQNALRRTLAGVVQRSDGVLSLGVRRADGLLVAQAGAQAGSRLADVQPRDQLSVALSAGGRRWGSVEIRFQGAPGGALGQWLREPMVVMMLFISAAGTLVFSLYMRRALQHLDPSSVIPERVQGAFDAMAEGVAVLDARGRVLLANTAFRSLHSGAGALRLGHTLSLLPWLHSALPSDPAAHPWAAAMASRTPNAGHTLELVDGQRGDGAQATRRLVVNCAPITDAGAGVRGCLVTFNDVSALHRSNQALLVTLAELQAAKDEVQRKNDELRRLATRDPMTACLNRRAFNEEFEALFQQARDSAAPLACVMLDIDHFKKVNDSFGHAVGDRVIQQVAKALHAAARPQDLVCRYGGEEFCVVLPGMGQVQALAFAEGLRAVVQRDGAAALPDVPGLTVHISVGLDMLGGRPGERPGAGAATPAALLDRADQGLYRAKRSGRNRVCVFEAEADAEAEVQGA